MRASQFEQRRQLADSAFLLCSWSHFLLCVFRAPLVARGKPKRPFSHRRVAPQVIR